MFYLWEYDGIQQQIQPALSFSFLLETCCYSLNAYQRSIYLHFLVSILIGHMSLEIYPFLLNFPIYDILKMSLTDSPDAISIVKYLPLHFIFLLINLVKGLSSYFSF